jgi:transcriptional regulator with XRE-family HTH domain
MKSERVTDCLVEIGRMIRVQRQARMLTLMELARDAEISRSQLSAIERGECDTTLGTIDRVLAVLELQLSSLLEPRWAKVDAAIAEARGKTVAQLLTEWADGRLFFTDSIVSALGENDVPFLVDGMVAVALQGAPVPVEVFEIAVRNDDDAVDRLVRTLHRPLHARRWNVKWAEFGTVRLDPREEVWTPPLYQAVSGKIRVQLVEDVTPTLWAESDGLRIPITPLVEIEATDRWAQRVLERMRNPPTT